MATLESDYNLPTTIKSTTSLVIRRSVTICPISPRVPWLLSVTESVALRPFKKGGPKCRTDRFNIREWLVPPVLLPIFFGLLIVAAIELFSGSPPRRTAPSAQANS